MNIRDGNYIAQIKELRQWGHSTYRYTIFYDESQRFADDTMQMVGTGEAPTLEECKQDAEDRLAEFVAQNRRFRKQRVA